MISQLSLYEENTPADKTVQEWGTFKDSLKAPVHRWFTYPAGFSYKAPFSSFNKTDDAIVFLQNLDPDEIINIDEALTLLDIPTKQSE